MNYKTGDLVWLFDLIGGAALLRLSSEIWSHYFKYKLIFNNTDFVLNGHGVDNTELSYIKKVDDTFNMKILYSNRIISIGGFSDYYYDIYNPIKLPEYFKNYEI